MWTCLELLDVKDSRLRIVVAAVSSRNWRFSPATLIVTTSKRSQRSIGISCFLSWVWARADPRKQATRRAKTATREVGFMGFPFQIDHPFASVLFRRTSRACLFTSSCFPGAAEAVSGDVLHVQDEAFSIASQSADPGSDGRVTEPGARSALHTAR